MILKALTLAQEGGNNNINEQKKAFATINHTGLFRLSEAFGQIIVGLWGLKMKSVLNYPEMEGITP
ncbi:MAG: hypothetical protein HQL78_05930 [Magnetococcales bacterium]|nr:hypothetical protein [Magnetococcales bacterium]